MTDDTDPEMVRELWLIVNDLSKRVEAMHKEMRETKLLATAACRIITDIRNAQKVASVVQSYVDKSVVGFRFTFNNSEKRCVMEVINETSSVPHVHVFEFNVDIKEVASQLRTLRRVVVEENVVRVF